MLKMTCIPLKKRDPTLKVFLAASLASYALHNITTLWDRFTMSQYTCQLSPHASQCLSLKTYYASLYQ